MKTKYSLQKRVIALGMMVIFLTMSLAVIKPVKVHAYQTILSKYTVVVEKNYLALRRGKAFKRENEIGKLYTGDTVIHCPSPTENDTYWYVYSPKHHKVGYVNRHYLEYDEKYTGRIHYTASVERGYLALRSAKAFDAKNETGKMYTGDEVIALYKDRHSDYWMVYCPDLEKAGYTNKNYLEYDDYYDDDDYYDYEDYDYDDYELYRDDGKYRTIVDSNTLIFRSHAD